MIVCKFGGTSVQDFNAISNVIAILKDKAEPVWVVVSAMSGVTNGLIEIADSAWRRENQELGKRLNLLKKRHLTLSEQFSLSKEYVIFVEDTFVEIKQVVDNIDKYSSFKMFSDAICSFGEVLSSKLVSGAINVSGLNTKHFDSRLLIKTDSEYGEAQLDATNTEVNLLKAFAELDNGQFAISGGFIASDSQGNTTTLGRGGSDYTAAIIGATLNSEAIEIWTDVDGIMTCDPRMIPNAKRIHRITYNEAAELAYFGAKVLHPKTILPAVKKGVPVVVLNTFNPNETGTTVANIDNDTTQIKAISFRKNITVINISSNRMLGAYGFLSKVFELFKIYKTPVDLVSTSEVSLSITIDNESRLDEIVLELSAFSSVSVSRNNAIISIVGSGLKLAAGVGARFFSALKGINVLMVSFGASEVNLSAIVGNSDLEPAVKALHKEFFGD